MNKLSFIISTLVLCSLLIGCGTEVSKDINTQNDSNLTDSNNEIKNSKKIQNTPKDQAIFEANNERDNTKVNERYKSINKSELYYEINPSSSTSVETNNRFIGSISETEPPIDNKEYKDILKYYTYAREVNPTNVTYETAIKLATSILPDDIKELRKKYYNGITYIVYSSSQGNFVVSLAYPYDEFNSNNFIPSDPNDTIVGISYMKEL